MPAPASEVVSPESDRVRCPVCREWVYLTDAADVCTVAPVDHRARCGHPGESPAGVGSQGPRPFNEAE